MGEMGWGAGGTQERDKSSHRLAWWAWGQGQRKWSQVAPEKVYVGYQGKLLSQKCCPALAQDAWAVLESPLDVCKKHVVVTLEDIVSW